MAASLVLATVLRYLFMALAIASLMLPLFGVEWNFFRPAAQNRYVQAWFMFEAIYWGLKYKLLKQSLERKS